MRRLTAMVLTMLAAGCAEKDRGFPSLALRPAESARSADAAPPAPVPSAVSGETAARLSAIGARIDAADAAFRLSVPDAEGKAAIAGPEGGEAWVAAQTALSALSTHHAELNDATDELDQLSRDLITSAAPSSEADLQATAEVIARATAIKSAEQATLSAIATKIAPRSVAE
ncbi:hypothetical protein [Sphingomonas sp. ID0503]|uniref:hypothetical protein n=1 Tax=Sphingomonas sp. ID0503 TaxID=3399691 RepID=UPI003AFA6B3E